MEHIIMDDWQEKVLKSTSKRICICKGRQIGGTTVFAKKAANRLANNKGEEIMVVSITDDQAQLVIMMTLTFLETYYPKLISKKLQDTTRTKIHLKNGSKIISRPVGQTGSSVRGFTKGVLWLNEASRLPEFVFEAAKPMLLTTDGDIWMDSTPFGKKGYFFNCFTNKNDIWEVYYKSTIDVINERQISKIWTEQKKIGALRLLEQERLEMTELQFGQEYLGLFLEDLRQFFTDELLNKVCILKKGIQITKKNNYLGVDIARLGGDECAYAILNRSPNGKIVQIENITKRKQLTTQTELDILHLNNQYEPKKIGIDAGSGSLGVGIYDRLLLNPSTKRKVIAMNNRAISQDRDGNSKVRLKKEDYYDNLRSLMEQGKILLFDDPKVFQSLKSIQWELVDTLGITKVKIFGKDSHIAEALHRAAWLAEKERYKKFVINYI